MPTAPRFGGGEHTTAAAHVAEGTLTGSVRSSASNARDSGDGSSGSPRGGGRLFSRSDVDAVGLARILHHFVVDEGHDVGTDRRLENGRKMQAFSWKRMRFGGKYVDERSRSHFGIFKRIKCLFKSLNFVFLDLIRVNS